jgi:hypothetical protein
MNLRSGPLVEAHGLHDDVDEHQGIVIRKMHEDVWPTARSSAHS